MTASVPRARARRGDDDVEGHGKRRQGGLCASRRPSRGRRGRRPHRPGARSSTRRRSLRSRVTLGRPGGSPRSRAGVSGGAAGAGARRGLRPQEALPGSPGGLPTVTCWKVAPENSDTSIRPTATGAPRVCWAAPIAARRKASESRYRREREEAGAQQGDRPEDDDGQDLESAHRGVSRSSPPRGRTEAMIARSGRSGARNRSRWTEPSNHESAARIDARRPSSERQGPEKLAEGRRRMAVKHRPERMPAPGRRGDPLPAPGRRIPALHEDAKLSLERGGAAVQRSAQVLRRPVRGQRGVHRRRRRARGTPSAGPPWAPWRSS